MNQNVTHSRRKPATVLLLALVLLCGASGFSVAAEKAEPEERILVFGHQNPDTDSIIGSIAAAYLLGKTGRPAAAMAPGAITPETNFVLKRFNLNAPKHLGSITGKSVGIVDFNDPPLAPEDMEAAKLVFIADHHKLGGMSTPHPLEAWIMPVGSVNTVLRDMYAYYGVDIPKDIAGGMLCAILSDTVILRSVTTTQRDKEAVAALADLAGVADVKALGIAMFKVKSAIEGTPAKELVSRDYKDFTMSGRSLGVGQIEVVDLSLVENRKKELLEAMRAIKAETGSHSVFLMLTDIMKEGTLMLAVTDDPGVVKTAFGAELDNNEVWLGGVMSRKKQIIPNLEAAFKK